MTLPARPPAAVRQPLSIKLQGFAKSVRGSTELQDLTEGDITPGIDDTPFVKFALDQLTRDEEVTGQGRHGSIISGDYPIDRVIGDEGLGYFGDPAPATKPPKQPGGSPSSSGAVRSQKTDVENVLLPAAPPEGTRRADLGFIPIALRPPLLILLIVVCLLMIAGLIFSNVRSLKSNGLYDYDGTGTPRYFVFEYLPQILGMFIILWLLLVQSAIYRIVPFMIMTSNHPMARALQDVPILPANFLFPHLVFFRVGEPLIGSILFIFWIANFTVPLLSCAYQTAFFGVWRWASVQDVGWTLVALYSNLVVGLILCIFRFRPRYSALKWDPVSLADLIFLFQKSNIMPIFDRSEISVSMRTHIPPRMVRLGYWTTSKESNIFYTIGEENAPVRPLTENVALKEWTLETVHTASIDPEKQRCSDAESFIRNIHSPFIRYRWTPLFLRDIAVLSWLFFAFALLITFLVLSFVNNAAQHGFDPKLPSRTNGTGFSSSNFLYSFLPCALGMFLFLAWQPIDTYFRAVQPFVNLSHPAGANAERSLLLAYPSCFPIETTVLALLNRDFKVAWISFVSIMSAALPVLAGGVFTAQLFQPENQVRVAASMPGYIALVAFVSIYTLSFLAVWPTRKRYLPHNIHTLAGLVSFLYQSPLLMDSIFREPETKAGLVARLLSRPGEANLTGGRRPAEVRYAFGIYVGMDGMEHLGIGRL